MKFRILERNESFSTGSKKNLTLLRRDHWDDYRFKTLFQVELIDPNGELIELGSVKILKRDQIEGFTEFDSKTFSELDDQYCSLGQDIEYYEKLATLPQKLRTDYLRSLRDAAFDPEISSLFQDQKGWNTSLLRFGAAEHALSAAPMILDIQSQMIQSTLFRHKSNTLGTEIEFDFNGSGPLPSRCEVIIGYNGAGKTRLLAEIATDISKVGLNSQTARKRDRTFASVVAVSYSAFDDFKLPYIEPSHNAPSGKQKKSFTTRFGYTYCGLRRVQSGVASTELKSLDELNEEVFQAFDSACERNDEALSQALTELEQDPSFGRSGLRLSGWVAEGAPPPGVIEKLSSGQKIVVNIVAQLAAHLRPQSLVLVDEPETHLHPPLLAVLLRAIQRLLEEFDSYAVVATHSPVVLQEVPARSIQVIERFGDVVKVVDPRIETFGAGLGELTHEVFGLDNTVADYRTIIRSLATQMTEKELEALFPLGMSSQARALANQARNRLR